MKQRTVLRWHSYLYSRAISAATRHDPGNRHDDGDMYGDVNHQDADVPRVPDGRELAFP